MPSPLPLYLLIGGKSQRFGVDKASYPIDGKPWAVDVISRLSGLIREGRFGDDHLAGDHFGDSSRVTLVGPKPPSDPQLQQYEFVHDVEPPMGVMSGVLAAARDHALHNDSDGSLFLLASCDLVRPEAEWLKPLVEAHEKNSELEVAAYYAADRWQPFPSVVSSRWLKRLETVTEASNFSLQNALSNSVAEAIHWPYPTQGPPQANTLDELTQNLKPSD